MKLERKKHCLKAACALTFAVVAGSASAELDAASFEVVAGNHVDTFTKEVVLPFFNQELSELSGGKLTANAVPYTELGLSGYEIMNLLELGTNDISFSVIGYMSADSPVMAGLELPGLTGDVDKFREARDAFRPILVSEMDEKFNSRLVFWLTHPKLQAYCKLTEEEAANFTLDTLKEKKVRVHSTTFADFVEGLGAVPVSMTFTDVIPSLERGVLDCAITSPTSAYGAGFAQVTNYVVDIPAGFSTHVYAINNDKWNALNAETQAFLTERFADVEARLTEITDREIPASAACLADGPCDAGEPGHMGLVTLSDADLTRLRGAVEDVVLDRWSAACGNECVATWNDTMGKVLGLTAPTK